MYINAKFNDSMNFKIDGNTVTMKPNEGLKGLEFKTNIFKLNDKECGHSIEFVRDINKNRTLKSKKLTNKYHSWISSLLWKCLEEGYISVIQ